MSAREWKPGDVAMVTAMNRLTPYKAMFVDGVWAEVGDIRPTAALMMPSSIRPLVVIDPEDREQVERLSVRFHNEFQGERRVIEGGYVDAMQAALREFADPKPRIEEPTGLGAVVEAIHDNHFVRVSTGDRPWQRVAEVEGEYLCRWSDIDVVRVLSEGVTA